MGLIPGDRVVVNYPVDDFPNHVGIVKEVRKAKEGKTIVVCYWPFLDKEIAFYESSLELI